MATQSAPPPGTPDEKNQNPGSELSKPVDGDGQGIEGDAVNESPSRPSFAVSQPMREDQVQNAVKFLSHPKVRGSPVIYRRSFLEKKGLTKEEIDEAFRRVPDPPSNATTVEAATTYQAAQPKPSAASQPQAPVQTLQPAQVPVSGVSGVPSLQQSRFHWSHALYAVGALAASGAGTAVLLKNVVVPRLKTWIRKVAAEDNENEKEDKPSPKLAEDAAGAAKAAASAAAVVAKASQELLDAKNEERKYFEAFMGALDVQVKEMKSMGDAVRKLESRRENNFYQDKLTEEHIRSIGNGPTNNLWRAQVSQADAPLSSVVSKQVNGTPNMDFEVRPSSAPASMEPIPATHRKSYMDITQRGEIPYGIKEVDDKPPNYMQPTVAKLKPWEVVQQTQQRPAYGFQSHVQNDRLSSEVQDTNGLPFQLNVKNHYASEPWAERKTVKITEIEAEAKEPRQFAYGTGANERPIQRGWVPPQPPTVAMPEAAAAIRHPKPSVQQQQSLDERPAASSDNGEQGAARALNSAVEAEASHTVFTDTNQTEIQEERADAIEVN